MTKQTRTIVVLQCDLHDDEVEAQETVSFSAGGTSYEMELCPDHLSEFNKVVDAWTAAARPLTRRRRPSGVEQVEPTRNGEDLDLSEVRDWARAHGHEVSDRGRVAQGVIDDYLAARGQAPDRLPLSPG
ncbi:MAG: histone-like nucleoid-structuring protein Lsr2 [Acidimicrobiales bacterium]